MEKAERTFLGQWIALTSVAWFLLSFFGESVLGVIGLGAMAVGQWFLLRRRHVTTAGWWIVATLAGFFIGAAIGGITGGWLQDSLDGVVDTEFGIRPAFTPGRTVGAAAVANVFAGACLGSAMGTAQWQVLRRHAHHEWSWLLSSIVSWSVGIGGSFFIVVTPAFTHAAGSMIVGVGSGIALLRCLPARQYGRARDRVATSA